jgi:hypothetical protein
MCASNGPSSQHAIRTARYESVIVTSTELKVHPGRNATISEIISDQISIKRSLYRVNRYRPRIDANPLPYRLSSRLRPQLLVKPLACRCLDVCHINSPMADYSNRDPVSAAKQLIWAYLYSRISSMYILPEPPGCGLVLSPRPTAIELTFVRFTP